MTYWICLHLGPIQFLDSRLVDPASYSPSPFGCLRGTANKISLSPQTCSSHSFSSMVVHGKSLLWLKSPEVSLDSSLFSCATAQPVSSTLKRFPEGAASHHRHCHHRGLPATLTLLPASQPRSQGGPPIPPRPPLPPLSPDSPCFYHSGRLGVPRMVRPLLLFMPLTLLVLLPESVFPR